MTGNNKMKLTEAIRLTEEPLPPDWDKDMFSRKRTSYRDMIAYAKEKAQKVGQGSSRVAFITPYEGRGTVLKVAMNRKGIVQNQEEADLLDDPMIIDMGITIPMIDVDEENGYQPTWIHTEFGQKIRQNQLERLFGVDDMMEITMYLSYITRGTNFGKTPELPKEVKENPYYIALEKVVADFDIPAMDFASSENWGLYRGEPVIIDLGYTDKTAELYR